ncbi:hypothetical protein BDZ94DRAFT_1308880 [Collybia nuda]|uniref:Uncharacterized protein n=1 Tax=Collybia nuda TaxID=64659 RepID=A0A9P5Y704_9AGAR|nr:hypothetical protein BDZ94DRAFT_1308880 [Collybia nuda]
MKRGFLKKPTKSSETTLTPKSEQTVKEPRHELIPIPEIKIPDFDDVPLQGTFPTSNFGFSIVTLPWPSIYRPLDRSSLCLLFPETKEKILALPNFPSPLISSPYSSQPIYSIKDVEGYGKGLFANVTIRPGELIICERPLIILPIAMPYVQSILMHPDIILEQMVNALSNNSRELFYA